MSDDSIDYADLRKFIAQLQKTKQLSDAEIQKLVMQQVQEAVAQKRVVERKEIAREAEAYSEALVRDPAEERARARDTAKSAALLLIMLLLILLLIAAATGRADILQFPGTRPTETIQPILGGSQDIGISNYVPPTPITQTVPQVDDLFKTYYETHGARDVFGDPISPKMTDNGRIVQWFQRARLEYWPELADQGYAVQGSLIGSRYIDEEKILFPTQQPFVSQAQVRYFAETGHGLSDRFLDFWNANDGMRVLGLPISDQLIETLSDQKPHTVQYFERGRLEYHPENGPGQQMLLGLLGQRLYANPDNVQILAPTQVPLPPSAAPTPVPATN